MNKYQQVFSYEHLTLHLVISKARIVGGCDIFSFFFDTEVSNCLPLVSLHQVNLGNLIGSLVVFVGSLVFLENIYF